MFKKLMRFTVIGATVFALAACGNQQGVGDTGNYGARGTGTMGAQGIGANSLHYNRSLTVDRNLARAVERIDGVSRANVLLGDRNAYVAVELDNTARNGMRSGTNGGNNAGNGPRSGMLDNGRNGFGQTGMGRVGPIGGVDLGGVEGYGRYAPMGGADRNGVGNGLSGMIGFDNTGMLGTDRSGVNFSGTHTQNFREADGTNLSGMRGNQGTGTTGVTGTTGNAGTAGTTSGLGTMGATGISGVTPGAAGTTGITGRNGGFSGMTDTTDYMADRYMNRGTTGTGTLNRTNGANRDGLPADLKSKINRIVRAKAGRNIRNVFISANPSFVRQMDVFASQLTANGDGTQNGFGLRGGDGDRNGFGPLSLRRPAQSLVNGFNQLVQTIFVEPFTDDGFGWDNRANNTRTNPRTMTNTAR